RAGPPQLGASVDVWLERGNQLDQPRRRNGRGDSPTTDSAIPRLRLEQHLSEPAKRCQENRRPLTLFFGPVAGRDKRTKAQRVGSPTGERRDSGAAGLSSRVPRIHSSLGGHRFLAATVPDPGDRRRIAVLFLGRP